MRLVDDEQPDPDPGDRVGEARQAEPLGCHVQQPDLTGDGALDGLCVEGAGALGVDELDAAGSDRRERLDLVLHQRDERRDHERQVVAHQRRQLIAERLARAGGHHHQRVAAVQRSGHRLLLAGAKAVEAEGRAQGVASIHRRATIAPGSAVAHGLADGPGSERRGAPELCLDEGKLVLERELAVRLFGALERVLAAEAGVAVRLA